MERRMSQLKDGLIGISKFLPSEVLFDLLRTGKIGLKAEQRTISCLFVDIDVDTMKFYNVKFTSSIAENLSPVGLVLFLSEFFGTNTRIMEEAEGTVDKFIGDCIFCFWNHPKQVNQHEKKSVLCGLEMLKVLRQRNKKREYLPVYEDEDFQIDFSGLEQEEDDRVSTSTSNSSSSSSDGERRSGSSSKDSSNCLSDGKIIPSYEVRIGINSGKGLVGIIGSKWRTNYTSIGDTVNISSRLEALNNRGEYI